MSEPIRQLRVVLGLPGDRLDKALAAAVPEALALSRSRLQALIGEGRVAAADGTPLDDPRLRLMPGTEVVLTLPAPGPVDARPEAIPLDIVFEDPHLIVIDKPAGLVVHPAPGARDGTLVNALLHHCGGTLSGIGGKLRPGIVHRIDKDTSGLLVVAKSDAAHRGLAAQFAAHDLERRYLAVAHGAPDPADPRLAHLAGISWEAGGVVRVEGNIGRHPGDRKRMAVLAADGKAAVTRARVLERFGPEGAPVASLLECRLETGRTHQIRVHMSFAGHPLVGDTVYGRRRGAGPLLAFPRQALHAASLGFVHPMTGEALRFESSPPADMQGLLAFLRGCNGEAMFYEPRTVL
jgi:23S rRNA pseudouridine1911/1915/1917 synthase